MRVVRVFAVINQKGGVGKTTTVANLGAVVASRGHRTCLIDLDPQAHLSLHFGIEPAGGAPNVYDVMMDNAQLDLAMVEVGPNLQLLPSVIDLAAAEVELVGTVGREQILRDRLRGCDLPCELVLIDCPPSLGLLTLNALAAADEVLIPLQPHFLALQGLGKLLETISLVQQRINPKLRVAGIVFCMYETATRLAAEVTADLAGFISKARGTGLPWSAAKIFRRKIRRNIKLAECPSHGQTIFDYDPHSHGAEDYLALADEFLVSALKPVAEKPRLHEPGHAPGAPSSETRQDGTSDRPSTGEAENWQGRPPTQSSDARPATPQPEALAGDAAPQT